MCSIPGFLSLMVSVTCVFVLFCSSVRRCFPPMRVLKVRRWWELLILFSLVFGRDSVSQGGLYSISILSRCGVWPVWRGTLVTSLPFLFGFLDDGICPSCFNLPQWYGPVRLPRYFLPLLSFLPSSP